MGKPKEVAPAAVPAGRRVYAVGDIHGRRDLLEALHDRILEDAADHAGSRFVVVYLGDYVDRGMQSREVVDLLLDEPLQGFETIHLKGNHEAFLLGFLEEPADGAGWLFNGGLQTLASYGLKPSATATAGDGLPKLQAELLAALPERHLDFYAALKMWHVEGDYAFVHAGIRPGTPLESQTEQDLLWIRESFLDSRADHGKVVVHGHTITWEPEVRVNRIGIDTGAFASGVLTCLVLDGETREFLHT